MPNLAAVRVSNASHFASSTVAVFVGGTAGVGEAMARAYGNYTKGNASIIIVGRNKEAAQRIFSEIPAPPSDEAKREFIQCDVSLMRNVEKAVEDIRKKVDKVNYLVLSTGLQDNNKRNETPEGLEYRLAVSYYARWKFINDLLPTVEKAKEASEPAVVFSVLAPGYGGPIDTADWEVKKNYSINKITCTAVTYNDLMVEALADRHPTISFIHAMPGIVRTNIFWRSPSYLMKATAFMLATIARYMTVSPEECAVWMWKTVAEGEETPGSKRTDNHGEDMGKENKYFGDDEKKEGLWKHTGEAIERMKASV